MKQNITSKQLNELSDKGKKTIRKWADDKVGIFDDYVLGRKPSEWLPLLSIGQMIEFLDGHQEDIDDDMMTLGFPWFRVYSSNGAETLGIKWKGELVDALWKACKEVLNEKN